MISPMTGEDAAGVARLAGQLGYPSTEAQIRARFALIASDPLHRVLVAREDGVAVGWLHFCRTKSLAADERLTLLGLVVDEAMRGRGIGSALIAAAEAWAREHGLRSVRFTSQTRREEAHRLYRRLGYQVSKTSYYFEKQL